MKHAIVTGWISDPDAGPAAFEGLIGILSKSLSAVRVKTDLPADAAGMACNLKKGCAITVLDRVAECWELSSGYGTILYLAGSTGNDAEAQRILESMCSIRTSWFARNPEISVIEQTLRDNVECSVALMISCDGLYVTVGCAYGEPDLFDEVSEYLVATLHDTEERFGL